MNLSSRYLTILKLAKTARTPRAILFKTHLPFRTVSVDRYVQTKLDQEKTTQL